MPSPSNKRKDTTAGRESNADDLYVEIRVPMTEVELDRVIARARRHGVHAEEYVAREIRAHLAKQPKVSWLACEMKLVRSFSGRRREP